jgi:hypothetical protein
MAGQLYAATGTTRSPSSGFPMPKGDFNLTIVGDGSASGTVTLQRRFTSDDSPTWQTVSLDAGGTPATFNVVNNTVSFDGVLFEPESGVEYSLLPQLSAGTVNWRVGQ